MGSAFPKEHLGVADKFLLKLAINMNFDAFEALEGRAPFRSYRFLYYLNETMKEFGYVGKEMLLIP